MTSSPGRRLQARHAVLQTTTTDDDRRLWPLLVSPPTLRADKPVIKYFRRILWPGDNNVVSYCNTGNLARAKPVRRQTVVFWRPVLDSRLRFITRVQMKKKKSITASAHSLTLKHQRPISWDSIQFRFFRLVSHVHRTPHFVITLLQRLLGRLTDTK